MVTLLTESPLVRAETRQPLTALPISDSLQRTLSAAVDEVGTALVAHTAALSNGSPSIGGLAGYALFFHHAARFTGDPAYRQRAQMCVGECARALSTTPMGRSLYGGVAGIAWLLAFLQNTEVDAGYDLDELDGVLLGSLSRIPPFDFDVIQGVAGVGAYFLERLPNGLAVDGLVGVVRTLEARAERCDDGVWWRTLPGSLLLADRAAYPHGRFDFGLAHGSAGVIALLAHVTKRGVAPQLTRALLARATYALTRIRFEELPPLVYPSWIAPGDRTPSRMTRTGWCYGDAGVAFALCAAADALDDAELATTATAMAGSALRRSLAQTGVNDACLCHGTAGLAHMAHVLWSRTHQPSFARAAVRWLMATVRARRPGCGIAGFEYFRGTEPEDPTRMPDASFLTGAAGIGLTMLAALQPEHAGWNRLLVLS